MLKDKTALIKKVEMSYTVSNEKPNFNQLQTLSEEELQGVVGGWATIQTSDGSVIQTQPGDQVQLPGGTVVTTFPTNPFT